MKQKVSLVLSGGGARGIAHIGVIEELEKRDYEISSIAGTSMGALVGGVYALGKMQEFKTWICDLDRLKVFNLVDFTFSKHGMVKGDKVLKTMMEFIPDGNIEDLRIPYVAVAADILNKKEVVFKSGSIYDAIRASISIPTVLKPVEKENEILVDGGVVNNIPINRVARTKDDLLIAVYVNANIPVEKPALSQKEKEAKEFVYQKRIKNFYNQLMKKESVTRKEKFGYFDLINKTISFMTYHMAETMIEKNSPDVLINVSRHSCGIYDFFKAEEMVEIGRLAASNTLNKFL